MTLFDIMVPLVALVLAGVGVLIVHLTDPGPKAKSKDEPEVSERS